MGKLSRWVENRAVFPAHPYQRSNWPSTEYYLDMYSTSIDKQARKTTPHETLPATSPSYVTAVPYPAPVCFWTSDAVT